MKPRLAAIFLLIVLAPLVTLAWLGVRVAHNERAAVRERFDALLASRLDDTAADVAGQVAGYEGALMQEFNLSALTSEQLRDLTRRSAYARQYFVLDANGDLQFPASSGALSDSEQGFVERTGEIWANREIAFSSDDVQSTAGKGGGRTVKGQVAPSSLHKGWHVWFDGPGINLLLWWEDNFGRIVGAEVNRARFMADVIGALPDTKAGESSSAGRIELADSAGRSLYVWGNYAPGEMEKPLVMRTLAPPFQSWQLRYYAPDPVGASTSAWFNIGAGLAVLALAVSALAFYFFREHTREMREASQRVSFVNQVSHELKTPLTSIRMYAELLSERFDGDDDTARRHLDIIESESRRLSRLIGNVLTFGRQQRSALTLRRAPGIPDELVREITGTFADALAANGIVVEHDAGAADEVLFDREVLEQILGNLLSNVEKYAMTGDKATVTTRQEGDTLTLVVADNGPGIPLNERGRIFGAFYRVGNKLTEGVSGTGIGLAITRDLARLHGGDVALEPGEQGARFAVTLHAPRAKEES